MRNLNYLNKFRVPLYGDYGDENNGAFRLKVKGKRYAVIASNGGGWEHVSVSHENEVPTWDVMCDIKDMFFRDDETVMQIHPKKSEYVNNHKNCLHLWRPRKQEIPLPPVQMV